MKRIAFIVATPTTADAFLTGHIAALAKCYEVDLIANYPPNYQGPISVKRKIHVSITRNINLWSDLLSLVALIRVFSSNRYDAVHSVTPKAGLLAMTAAWIVGIPVRHHTFTGQVWVTRHGPARWFLRALDKLTHYFSTKSLVDSHSQRDFLLREKVVRQDKSYVLAKGSIAGVNTERFKPDSKKRDVVRMQYNLTEDDFVFLYLGRVNEEKGILELISAFKKISGEYPKSKLLVVGSDEARIFEDGSVEKSFSGKLIRVGFTTEPEAYFNAADLFCLPSHREGFGSVLIEAAACGRTSVASNIYGISDAVIDGCTGLLHAAQSESDLARKMEIMISQSEFRSRLEDAAIRRACNEFSSFALEQELVEFYREAFF
jgi:glycosyltransferase involved in cell wall biosynthesis